MLVNLGNVFSLATLGNTDKELSILGYPINFKPSFWQADGNVYNL